MPERSIGQRLRRAWRNRPHIPDIHWPGMLRGGLTSFAILGTVAYIFDASIGGYAVRRVPNTDISLAVAASFGVKDDTRPVLPEYLTSRAPTKDPIAINYSIRVLGVKARFIGVVGKVPEVIDVDTGLGFRYRSSQ